MAFVMTSGPAVEPVTVAEAKAHLRLETSDEDILVASLILTARLQIEAALGTALITQSWRLILDAWPKGAALTLPLRPVSAITALRLIAADGSPVSLSPGDVLLDGESYPARLVRKGAAWPPPARAAAGIEIDLTAGYGSAASAVPEPIRHAVLMLAAHWYEHRDPLEIGSAAAAIPPAISALLEPYRRVRL